MPGEFALIERIRARARRRDDVVLGIGDDAALLAPPLGRQLVVTADTLNDGVHFPRGTSPADVGWKALAVNLSDLASMGAEPAWCTLSLSLPQSDPAWIEGFLDGFLDLAGQHGIALVGGDTTRGPLTASVMLAGTLPAGAALLRSGARAGDDIWISGTPGDAGAGLAILQGRLEAPGDARDELLRRFLLPEPRVALGRALRGLASACIDVSDGLAGDLAKLCAASGAGGEIEAAQLPLSPALLAAAGAERAVRFALASGDDYELLFTARREARTAIGMLAAGAGCRRIGTVTAGAGVRVRGAALPRDAGHGFDHFGG